MENNENEIMWKDCDLEAWLKYQCGLDPEFPWPGEQIPINELWDKVKPSLLSKDGQIVGKAIIVSTVSERDREILSQDPDNIWDAKGTGLYRLFKSAWQDADEYGSPKNNEDVQKPE